MPRIFSTARTLALCLLAPAFLMSACLLRFDGSNSYMLSDGCRLNSRGIGSCAPLVGAAHGGNDDPGSLEADLGQRLGVRRTYWSADQVVDAVESAHIDISLYRIPWMSFKLPASWEDMASGSGDAWVRDLSTRLAHVPGPVWIAFHHEPEGDGNITAWKEVQERLGPIVRSLAGNVAFTVILTGLNQWYGEEQYSIEDIWPATQVDLAGFDVYCYYGTWKDGKYREGEPSLKAGYFDKISAWATKSGIAWGLAETGLTDAASRDYPHWISDTYRELRGTGSLAMVYFDSEYNSDDSYHLTGGPKNADFRAALRAAPTLLGRAK